MTTIICTVPMKMFDLWNGKIPDHRNQYELMTESILNGSVEFNYGDESELLKVKNPYDPEERTEAGIQFHWDHSYYDGHYYMYFGIVPVFLTFLPYRILTGETLLSYQATQFFVVLIIAGIFSLFYLLTKLFFKNISLIVFLFLSVAFSIMSVWYSVVEPALYCTAITAGLALQIWSIYFYVRAVYYEKKLNKQIKFAFFGALFGALVFGCRPPMALANLLVIPMFIHFLKQHKFDFKLLLKILLVVLPYVVIGVSLMYYNYIRYDNPFEFGQSYQLTLIDQTKFYFDLNIDTIKYVFKHLASKFLKIGSSPIVSNFGGLFINFPILLIIFMMFKRSVRNKMKELKILSLSIFLCLTILLISIIDVLGTPYLFERYNMDIYFLFGIICFIIICVCYSTFNKKWIKYLNCILVVLALFTIVSSFSLYIEVLKVSYFNDAMEIIKFLQFK